MARKKKNNSTTKTELSKKNEITEKTLEIKKLKEGITNLNEKNVKLLAEFDNFQRRTYNEKEQIKKYQSLDIIKDLLPSIDDIERIINFSNVKKDDSTIEAIKMVNSKIESTLKKHFIVKFESSAKTFDPHFHEALLEQNSDSVKVGKIIEEFEKGYMYHKRILRHAKVVVSKGKGK